MSELVETEPIGGIIKGITERSGIVLDPSFEISSSETVIFPLNN
jgi:hypothetical protein